MIKLIEVHNLNGETYYFTNASEAALFFKTVPTVICLSVRTKNILKHHLIKWVELTEGLIDIKDINVSHRGIYFDSNK